jgi:hypothetical protein
VEPIRLRAHHLVCLLSYVGRGYSPRFVATMDDVAAQVARGEAIALVEGPDALCDALEPASEEAQHCHAERNRERDAVALRQVEATLARRLGTRFVLSPTDLDELRAAFADGRLRASCTGCEWAPLCDEVSRAHFEATRLFALRRGRG